MFTANATIIIGSVGITLALTRGRLGRRVKHIVGRLDSPFAVSDRVLWSGHSPNHEEPGSRFAVTRSPDPPAAIPTAVSLFQGRGRSCG
jgi:hypothetical protein